MMRDYAKTVNRLRNWPRICAEYKNSVDELHDETADAIEELLAAVPKWISVDERLPEVEQSVLFCVFGRSVGEGTYRGHDGFHHVWKMYAVAGTYWDDEVTHWMPLPAPPKGVE